MSACSLYVGLLGSLLVLSWLLLSCILAWVWLSVNICRGLSSCSLCSVLCSLHPAFLPCASVSGFALPSADLALAATSSTSLRYYGYCSHLSQVCSMVGHKLLASASASGSAFLSVAPAFAATSSASTSGYGYLVGCWCGLSVQSGVVIGVASGFGPSAYVVLKGSVLASVLVSGLLVGSGGDVPAAFCGSGSSAVLLGLSSLSPATTSGCLSCSGCSLMSAHALGGSGSLMVSAFVYGAAIPGSLIDAGCTVGDGVGLMVHAAGPGVSAAWGLVHVVLCLVVLLYTLSVLLVGYASLFGASSQASGSGTAMLLSLVVLLVVLVLVCLFGSLSMLFTSVVCSLVLPSQWLCISVPVLVYVV